MTETRYMSFLKLMTQITDISETQYSASFY